MAKKFDNLIFMFGFVNKYWKFNYNRHNDKDIKSGEFM